MTGVWTLLKSELLNIRNAIEVIRRILTDSDETSADKHCHVSSLDKNMDEHQEAYSSNRKLSHREIIWNVLIKLLKLTSKKEIKPETG